MPFLRFVHLFSFLFWYGTLLYFSFVQTPILLKTLSRQLFGEVQSHLFPAYYLISYICGTLLVVTYHLLHPLKNYVTQDCVKITALCLMLLFSLAQGLWIGPQVGRLRLERQAAEEAKDQPKVDSLSKEFGKAHGISSLLNLIVIISGTVYFVYLAKEITP
jgi:hypothetical protein